MTRTQAQRLRQGLSLLGCVLGSGAGPVAAQETLLELQYTPVPRAQVAIWVEDAAGNFLRTVALTEAVAFRGIGNRPGASQLNSGYRWPYGRREGVLPVWAHRRASAPGAMPFPRVIFQGRPEGYASRVMFDQSRDAYYCLQFDPRHSTRDELDAVSCATPFSSDKGRYMTADDLAQGYAEPWEEAGVGGSRPLPLHSLYPPRMDLTARCSDQMTCYDHPDVERYAADARAVMPELDSVTRATPPGNVPQKVLFSVPASWPAGDYRALIEVNVEGDYDAHWNDARFPTPRKPETAWDSYGWEYGYAYRGQPSIVYAVPFTLDSRGGHFGTEAALGRSDWDVWDPDYGELAPITLSPEDPLALVDTAGSGVDRLRRDAAGERFSLDVKPPGGVVRPGEQPIAAIEQLALSHHPDPLRSHAWVQLSFLAPRSVLPLHEYEVRVATEPITDEASFIVVGRPAKNATDSREGATALMLPVDAPEGARVAGEIGDLSPQTHYYVGVRATDEANHHGPVAVAEITTTAQTYATVTPCFIATAAYGSPLAQEVSVLRRFRDRQLLTSAPGQQLVAAYYAASPAAARMIANRPWLRAAARALLTPLTAALTDRAAPR